MKLIDVCEHLEDTARKLVEANGLEAGGRRWEGGGGEVGGGWGERREGGRREGGGREEESALSLHIVCTPDLTLVHLVHLS